MSVQAHQTAPNTRLPEPRNLLTGRSLPFPPLARFRFHLCAEDPIRMPDYPGSAWRGLLGHGLRRTACVTRQPTCAGCLLAQQCVYSTLFETPAPPDAAARGYTTLPHPYVLAIDPRAPRHFAPGETFTLTIHLLGPAIAHAPYLIHALGLAGQRGFGRTGGRFAVHTLERETGLGSGEWISVYSAATGVYQPMENARPQPPAPPPEIRLQLLTPLRIKRDGHFLGARDLTAADLVRTLQRRLCDLARHDDADAPHLEACLAGQDLAGVQLLPVWLRWHEWTRYSSRQNTLMQFGGLIGEIRLAGSLPQDLWPLLWLGQWTHLGKGTAFGLGGYRIPDTHEAPSSQGCDSGR